MIFVWKVAVMTVSIFVVYRCMAMANMMDARSNHAIRFAVWALAVVALGEVLAPLTGRAPNVAEGVSMLSIALYFAGDRRRLSYRRAEATQDPQT